MYSLLLIASIFVVVLSPLLLDFFLSLQEVQAAHSESRPLKEKIPNFAWASHRGR